MADLVVRQALAEEIDRLRAQRDRLANICRDVADPDMLQTFTELLDADPTLAFVDAARTVWPNLFAVLTEIVAERDALLTALRDFIAVTDARGALDGAMYEDERQAWARLRRVVEEEC